MIFEARNGMIILKGDASQFKPRPAEGDSLRRMQEFREKLRQFAPKEYEAMMKRREEILKKRQLEQKPTDENPSEQGPTG